MKIMETVGGSMVRMLRRMGFAGSAMESPMVTEGMPAKAKISPASTTGTTVPFQSLENEQLLDLSKGLFVARGKDHDRVAGPDPSSQEAADADAPDIIVMGDVGDQSESGLSGSYSGAGT